MTTSLHPTSLHPTTLHPTDNRFHFAQAVTTAGTTLAAVRPDQIDSSTPCAEFDVRTLIGHMLVVLRRVALLGEGGDPMALPSFVTGITDTGWHDAWIDDAHRVQVAWTDDETLTRMMVLPWVQAPGSAMLAMYTSELSVHTWDLAMATGQHPAWNEQAIRVALQAASQALPSGDRHAAFAAMAADMPPHVAAGGPPFGNPVTAAPGAPLIDRLVGWYGRQP